VVLVRLRRQSPTQYVKVQILQNQDEDIALAVANDLSFLEMLDKDDARTRTEHQTWGQFCRIHANQVRGKNVQDT
jgi:hypothetical protein